MAASAGAVRAGGAFVEIFAKDGKFQQAMTRVQNRLRAVAESMRRIGTKMTIGSAAIGAPLVMAMRQFTAFDDVLRATRASTGMSAAEMDRLRAAALAMSKELGVGPTEVASAFMELLKAGMSLEQVLNGAGRAALQFAKVGGMEVSEAAVVMSDAMNVFGVSAETAANTLSSAADASSTDIAGIAQAFSQVSAVAGLANQSIADTAAALAILANNGIKGSDAGTSLKTMLMRLMAPADDAVDALAQLGLSTQSFRNADGTMRPLVEIIGILNNAMVGMNQAAKDDIFRRIFGQDAIRAAAVLTSAGVAGFNDMRGSMNGALSVSQKFKEMTDGLSGSLGSLMASLQRLAIAFGNAVAPAVMVVARLMAGFVDIVEKFAAKNPVLSQVLAGVVAGVLALGVAMIVGGYAVKVFAAGIGALQSVLSIIPMLCNPVSLAIIGIGLAVAGVVVAARSLSPAFKTETDAIWAAIMQLDFSTAWEIMNLNFTIALVQMAAKAASITSTIQGFFAATGAFIGDKLIEGMDRFMGLFGADILTLQAGWEKLGVYFRAAFDWKFAASGMRQALAEVDARIEKERGRAPTADARAENRAKGRQEAADLRQAQMDQQAEAAAGVVDDLRHRLDMAHDRLKPKPAEEKPADPGTPPATPPAMPPAGAAATAAARAGVGQTLGGFSGEGIGIGPELAKLEDPAKQTAANTAVMAAGIQQIAAAGGVAAGAPALAGLPGKAAAAQAGTQAAAESPMVTAMAKGMEAIVAAIASHAKLTEASVRTLVSIDGKLSAAGGVFL